MKRFIRFLTYVFFVLSIFAQQPCFSEPNFGEQEYFSSSLKKIYIEPDQIYISNDGIYVNVEGNFCLVDNLFYDTEGIFTIEDGWKDKEPACGHGLYCRACGGCSPRNTCKYRCRCER